MVCFATKPMLDHGIWWTTTCGQQADLGGPVAASESRLPLMEVLALSCCLARVLLQCRLGLLQLGLQLFKACDHVRCRLCGRDNTARGFPRIL